MRTLCAYLSLILLTAFFSACEHKELCYDYSESVTLRVRFDWSKAPDAHPRSMMLYFFPKGGGNPIWRTFVGREGGDVLMPPGSYDVIAYNGDTEAIFFDKTNQWDTFKFYARTETTPWIGVPDPPKVKEAPNERYTLAPDMLWTTQKRGVEIKRPKTKEKQEIVFFPEKSLYTYTIEVRNAKNLKYVSNLGGALSGMAGGLLAAKNEVLPPPVIIPYEVNQKDDTTIIGSFHAFGGSPTSATKHQLVIYAFLADHTKWYYTTDITEQVKEAERKAIEEGHPRDVHVIVDRLPFPKPITNGSGLKPEIDEWDNIDIELNM